MSKQLGRRIALGPSRDVHLAEEHQPLAFAVLQERAVLEAEAAVEDRQEITLCRLLDQNRGDVPSTPAAPDAGDVQTTPLDHGCRLAVGLADRVLQAGRQDRRLASPVAQALDIEPFQQRVIGHAGEDLPQAVLRDAEPEPLFEHFAGLLEHDDLEPVAHAADVGARPVQGERTLANHEDVVAVQVCVRPRRDGTTRPSRRAA